MVTNGQDPEAEVMELNIGWGGETPFFLILELADGQIGVDLDSPWTIEHAEHLRKPGTWWLVEKESRRAVLGVIVDEGDQPYFTKHHVGNLMAQRELVAYGLGKKCADGTMVRNWLLPNGIVCGGDDVDVIASRMLNG
jgi:hypothetical protein